MPYKIVGVANLDGEEFYTSLSAGGDAEVQYEVGKFTEAGAFLAEAGYHLLYFDNLDDLYHFKRTVFAEDNEIFECEIEEKLDEIPPRLDLYGLEVLSIVPVERRWPEGTCMAKKIKLVRKLR